MSTQVEMVDLASFTIPPRCVNGCGREAQVIAKGCMDKEGVQMCNPCLLRGLEVVRKAVDMYQRFNKRICVCGDCHRPILNLETHVDIQQIR